jgi:hypothetical protein
VDEPALERRTPPLDDLARLLTRAVVGHDEREIAV